MVHQFAKVLVHFVDRETGECWKHPGGKARLFDSDPAVDDFLGDAPVVDGTAEILFDLDDARSLDTPRETLPDLYVVLEADGRELLRTPVQQDVNFLARHPKTDQLLELTRDLGTFEVG
jgi:hypothetical protein